MRPFAFVLLLPLLMFGESSAFAQLDPAPSETSITISPENEARARALGRTLRCVVCQNQSIEESDAELAADMRTLVREALSSGSTEAEVTALMRDRYGDYVLLKPPVQGNTLVLWFAPLIAIFLGLVWFISLKRKRQSVPVEALSDEERERLEALRQS
ncbi:cytochrome c biogenesis protein [Algimonas ampicilliniresistens]|jgi:cytochrome c-type biogenesis protein CcmH|uniref:Cytochrome c-type biogenesis protein n=1 Tax=Algimonas ampicilliniresistens TaxID=1298735 RepID=A0ABQ5V6L5_9PROT|nr:cytochrome c-type biogenesis protein [Algimonas ampicilliniresistens]GLQ22720.1 cytochrome c biogenesis protein [Algimonas ampicilliniresistens]